MPAQKGEILAFLSIPLRSSPLLSFFAFRPLSPAQQNSPPLQTLICMNFASQCACMREKSLLFENWNGAERRRRNIAIYLLYTELFPFLIPFYSRFYFRKRIVIEVGVMQQTRRRRKAKNGSASRELSNLHLPTPS